MIIKKKIKMEFKILNRKDINVFTADVPYAVISITEPYDFFTFINTDDKNLIALFRIKFPDADKNFKREGKTIEVLSNSDAEDILDFVFSIRNRVQLIVCQCDGGISRSSAVAAALGKIFNNDDTFVFNFPKYKPNMFVYRKIINMWFEL